MSRIKILMLAHRYVNPGFLVIMLILVAGGLQYMIDGTGQTLTIILIIVFWGGLGLDTVSRALAQNHSRVDSVGFFKLTTLCLWCMLYGPFAHRLFRR
jgi:hypothetical protein